MTPTAAAFIALATALHAAPCKMPTVTLSTDYITHVCQKQAKPGWHAVACYAPLKQTIYLKDSWDGDNAYDLDQMRYEMARHVTEICLHGVFNPSREYWREYWESL